MPGSHIATHDYTCFSAAMRAQSFGCVVLTQRLDNGRAGWHDYMTK